MSSWNRLTLDEGVALAHSLAMAAAAGAGARAVVIKGPAARHHGLRPDDSRSIDVDVWVAPGDHQSFTQAMESLGWRVSVRYRSPSILKIHSDAYVHPLWPCEIDVHHRFPGLLAPPEVVFTEVWARRTLIDWCGTSLAIPGLSVSFAIEALHILRSGPEGCRRIEGWVEQHRGLMSRNQVQEFAEFAFRAGAWETLQPVIDALSASDFRPVGVGPSLDESLEDWRLKVAVGDQRAVSALVALRRARLRDRPRILWNAVWLSEAEIYERRPWARRGRLALLGARCDRWISGLGLLPPAIRAIRRAARREEPRV